MSEFKCSPEFWLFVYLHEGVTAGLRKRREDQQKPWTDVSIVCDIPGGHSMLLPGMRHRAEAQSQGRPFHFLCADNCSSLVDLKAPFAQSIKLNICRQMNA